MTLLSDFAARRPRMLLIVFCLGLWLPAVFALPPGDRDESRFAQATKQMLETGDFVNIRNGDEARNRKPIGIHWLQAAAVTVVDATGLGNATLIWPYRIPSVLGALAGVLATFAIGRRLGGVPVGLLAGAMLGGCVLVAVEATIAKTDAALLGATTVAMGVLIRAYLGDALRRRDVALFWVAVGGGILLKGPLTPMVVALTVVTLVIVDRRARWLGALRAAWGVPLMLAVVLPWFVAIGIASHGQFFREAVGGDLGGKLAGGDDAHGAPPGYYLVLLSLALFPSAVVALQALPGALARRGKPATRVLLAWLVPCWCVFEAVPTKLPHYPLPLYPALCLIAAGWLLDPMRRPAPHWLRGIAIGATAVAAMLLGLGAIAVPVAVAWPDLAAALRPALFALPTLAGIAALGWIARGVTDPARAAVWRLAAVPLVYWGLLAVVLPRAQALWIAPRVAAALRAHGRNSGFASVGFAEPSLMFACGTATRLLSGGAAGAAFLAGDPGRVVAVERRDDAAFATASAAAGLALHAFATVDGINYSNGRRVHLTLYDRTPS